MNQKFIYTLILLSFFLLQCSDDISSSLLPTSVEKTIKRFNYCMNQIDQKAIFETLEQIVIGEAREEYRSIKKLISQNKKQRTELRQHVDRYRDMAKALKIKIESIELGTTKAKASVIYFNQTFLIEEKKNIYLQKVDGLWKIEKIASISE